MSLSHKRTKVSVLGVILFASLRLGENPLVALNGKRILTFLQSSLRQVGYLVTIVYLLIYIYL